MTTELDNLIALKLPPRIRSVHAITVTLPTDFIDVVRPFSHMPGTVALMSGGRLDCARYHIMGVFPMVTLTAKHRRTVFEVADNSGIDGNITAYPITCNPFDALQAVLRRYQLHHSARCPMESGLLGYLSYDLKDALEELPQTSIDDLQLPDLYMTLPKVLVVRDLKTNKDTLFTPLTEADADTEAAERFRRFLETIASAAEASGMSTVTASPFRTRFTSDTYMDAIETIREYIAAGDVYQVNMSQRFSANVTGKPFELYAKMFLENPAAFFAYLNPGDHQILSTSPERFIQLKPGASEAHGAGTMVVETRPIKGTRPRGDSPAADAALMDELRQSPKEDAELSMIVDLQRNDIGKVCRAGSVVVKEHKRLESYENVHHMISIVTGVLDKDNDAVDLIRATFPGGSITGCPKIRSMEIIDELEPVRRHIYTGSIGYLSFHNTMDLSIAIRTATVSNGRMVFSVGGGIVYDSNPADEYQETLDKGRTLMRSVQGRQSEPADAATCVWRDGLIQKMGDTSISIEDEGFLYGYGFFETIRVDNGTPKMLDLHMARFERAWQWCFDGPPPDITWNDVIAQVIGKNQLTCQVAAVKILAAAKKADGSALPYTLLVTSRPYRHRLLGTAAPGLRLGVYPHRRHTSLADHKTMNYMFYRMAGKWAAERHLDEALICNVDGSVSETNTANIFCRKDGRWLFPHSDHFLEGTFQTCIKGMLRDRSETLQITPVSLSELAGADAVFACNALMGVVPVIALDSTEISPDVDFCDRINNVLL
ncbi:MAG: aminodeoxychorismate synthase component I [Deltaproteobacteria bacterium]|nr:aminodeoxychorismate synthase component I [Deltaproteobacteria bacterium]